MRDEGWHRFGSRLHTARIARWPITDEPLHPPASPKSYKHKTPGLVSRKRTECGRQPKTGYPEIKRTSRVRIEKIFNGQVHVSTDK